MNKKNRKTIPPRKKKYLQQEINSECPFCKNREVGHFEIHHIDENPSNNDFENLLMLCPICHSKITKGEINTEEVIFIKKSLVDIKSEIEFVNVFVEKESYNWKLDNEYDNVFYYESNKKSKNPHLVLNWSFLNHLKKTTLLKKIIISATSLPSGLNGPAFPTILSSIITYKIPIIFDKGKYSFELSKQIQIPESQGVQFQTELFGKYLEHIYPLNGRFYIDFKFSFSNNQSVKIPRLFFNCKTEDEKLPYYTLN